MDSLTKPENVKYKKFFEGVDDPCVVFEIVDNEPIIISVNTSFEETFVTKSGSAFATNLNDLIVPSDKMEKAKKLDQQTKQGELNEVEVERETKHGMRNFLYRGIPVDHKLGFGIYIDITQRHREREYIAVLQRILRHNLRNDINVIRGFTNQANQLSTDDEVSDCLSKALEKTARVKKFIEEANTIRHIINEDFEPSLELMSVEKIAGRAIGQCLSEFSSANVGIECTDELTVKAGSKLQIAFEAVIDNGLRYNESEQPKVMIRGHEVSGNRVHISIADNGVGIASTEQRIVTGDKQPTRLEHGSGLGLWMTKWVIESYQGVVEIHNSHTGGTVVEFWLNCQ